MLIGPSLDEGESSMVKRDRFKVYVQAISKSSRLRQQVKGPCVVCRLRRWCSQSSLMLRSKQKDMKSLPGSFLDCACEVHQPLIFCSQPWERTASLGGKRRPRPPALPRIPPLTPLIMVDRRLSTPSNLPSTIDRTRSTLLPSLTQRSFRCRRTKALCRTMAITKRPMPRPSKHRTRDLSTMVQIPSRMMAAQSLRMTRFATLYKQWRQQTYSVQT